MDKTYQESHRHLFAAFSEVVSVITFFAGGIVLLGWALDISAMKSVLPGLVTMKANTALCFMLVGLALWLSQARRMNKITIAIARTCCFIAIVIPGLTIIEYVYSVNLGIDQMIFKEDIGALLTADPGRMAVNTAICFVLLSIGLLLSNSKNKRVYSLVQFLALVVSILSVLSLLGYAYGVKILYFGIQGFTAMALHTAVVFFMISMGVFFAHPDQGLTVIITSDGLGSKVARRLIPIVIIIPPCLGWLKLWGEKTGWLPHEFGVSFVAIMNMITMVSCITWLAIFLNRADAEREKAEAILRASEQQLQASNQQLIASQQQLRASNQQLAANEQKLRIEIEERKKMEESNSKHMHELEIFYNSAMGREERIIELKKEVESLKEKLKK